MQAAPAVTVSVGRDSATLAVFAGLCALAAACSALWAAQRADLLGGLAFAAVVGFVALSIGAWVREPVRRLRWDGQGWWLGTAGGTAEPLAGDVTVAIDLDVWLLLRFHSHPPSGVRRTQWLALRRSGHRSEWHALRCAVFSPRRPSGLTAG